MNEKSPKVRSIKWQMMAIALTCWLAPVLLVLAVMTWYLADTLSQRTARTLADQFQVNVRMCADRLDSAVEASRLASYDPTIQRAWRGYQRDRRYASLYLEVKAFLDRQYRADSRFLFSVLWFAEDPDRQGLATLTESAGARYEQVRTYWNQDHAEAKDLAAQLDTAVGFLEREGRLYLVRNLLDASYQTIGTLILALNPSYYFDSLTAFPWASEVTVTLGQGVSLPLKGESLTPQALGLDPNASDIRWEGPGRSALEERTQRRDYTLTALAAVDLDVLVAQLSGYKYLLLGMALLLLPLLLLVFRFFRDKISRPVQAMMDGAREIEEGRLGHQLTYRANSREFQYLADSFNHMSGRLRNQFDRIYQEELALRDARIKALQSHINPHFLNNTLEIINWEARMNGDVRVSKMIEALSTLLDAAVARDKRPEITLAEELGYVEAYLYIIDQRFGKRLTVTRDIDEDILDCQVPRLILQPVIENAVEHGIGPGGKGTISLRGRREGDRLLLEIGNDGGLSPEDEAHIAKLLAPDCDASKESSGNLGISNVNQRLRILYGEPSGLTIRREAGDHVVARLTIVLGEER